MKTAAFVAAGMLTWIFAGVSLGEETPAFPPIRLEAVGVIGTSLQARPGEWTIVSLGQGPKTVFVDGVGQLIEHRLVSWELGVPTETTIIQGQLYVRHGGRTYKYAPQGQWAPSVGVANVTRAHQGLILTWVCTNPELVQTKQWVPVTQWVEVSPPPAGQMAPTSAPPAPRSTRPNST